MFWFGLTKDIVKNHVITTDINEYPEPFKGDKELDGRSTALSQ